MKYVCVRHQYNKHCLGRKHCLCIINKLIRAITLFCSFSQGASEVKGTQMRAGVMNGNKMPHMQVNCVNGPTVISMIRVSIITNI